MYHQNKCKICPNTYPTFDQLKRHWKLDHGPAYVKVQTWLTEVDQKILQAEIVIEQAENTAVETYNERVGMNR